MLDLTIYSNPKNEWEVRFNIIAKYFAQWSATVMTEINLKGLEEKFAFVDLCAGWGRTEQQQLISNQILKLAIQDKSLCNTLSLILNDKDPNIAAQLVSDIEETIQNIEMGFAPQFFCSEVDAKISLALSLVKNLPSFLSLDIWNYTSIDLNLVRQWVKNNGCDCFLIFDYKSICSSILKEKKEADLIRIFGKKASQELQTKFKEKITAFQKEQAILTAFKNAVQHKLGSTTPLLQYKFYDEKNKTSHYIFFITQNPNNYALMREILANESQIIEDGIGNLEFNPNLGPQKHTSSQTLFGSMFELEQDLLKTYKSQTLQIIDIYENHHKGRPLVKKNYIDALLNLERKNKITITRKKLSRFATQNNDHLDDKVFVSFNKT